MCAQALPEREYALAAGSDARYEVSIDALRYDDARYDEWGTTCRAACRARAGAEDQRAAYGCELKEGGKTNATRRSTLSLAVLCKGDDAYRYEMINESAGDMPHVTCVCTV